jgi:hypothetical protein
LFGLIPDAPAPILTGNADAGRGWFGVKRTPPAPPPPPKPAFFPVPFPPPPTNKTSQLAAPYVKEKEGLVLVISW